MTDKARPGLVTFYDIRPGNGAGLFSQTRNLHGAGPPGKWQLKRGERSFHG